MKTPLLIILSLGMFSANAQTTHDLDWYSGIGSSVDLTINSGDTVRWTWGDALPHTVENIVGNSVETFDSGTKTGVGMTYSYTFTVIGDNDYFCGIHGVVSMSGTITVNPALSVDDKPLSSFNMFPNPSHSMLHLDFPQMITKGAISVFDVLGKEYLTKNFENTDSVELNISSWGKGVYFIKLRSSESSQTKQFIKN